MKATYCSPRCFVTYIYSGPATRIGSDGETVRLSEDCSLASSNAVIAPVLQLAYAGVAAAACGGLEDFDEADCIFVILRNFAKGEYLWTSSVLEQ